MSTSIHLLVVEDNDGQYETYKDTADDINDENANINFILQREKNPEDAKAALLSSNFDAAIVDLNLDKDNATEASGNEILKKMIGSHRFPIFVVSGNLGNLDVEIKEKESSFLKCYDRDKSNDDIFDEIQKICNTGITRILGGRGLIEKNLADIFWNHLADDLDVWLPSEKSPEKSLLRYTISHLSEYLDTPSDGDDLHTDAEFYIKPPIREHIATGDIAQHNNLRFVVLSPACDVATRVADKEEKPIINADRLILAKLIRVNRADFIENNIISEDDNSNVRSSALDKIIRGQQEKYIFIPAYKTLVASIIDLQNLYSIDFNDYIDNYKRVATIASPFLKDIQSRFSSYYGRQGQPDLNKKELLKKHKADLSP